jgi:hypothetical protein
MYIISEGIWAEKQTELIWCKAEHGFRVLTAYVC